MILTSRTTDNPPLPELIARAIADGLGDDIDHAHLTKSEWNATRGEKGGRFRDINEPMRGDYLSAGEAVFTTLRKAGYEVVLRDPTDHQIQSARRPYEDLCVKGGSANWMDAFRVIYRAMVDAS